jgi:hypothetical protein
MDFFCGGIHWPAVSWIEAANGFLFKLNGKYQNDYNKKTNLSVIGLLIFYPFYISHL